MNLKFWMWTMLLLVMPTVVLLMRPGIHNIQDNMQYFRIYEMDKCLNDGQFPCRWVPDMGYGFGYPLYIYYSPGPYYVGFGLHELGFQYIDAVKLLFIGGAIVAALGMWSLAYELSGRPILATLGASLYVYAPVRAVQMYVRGSLGEYLAMMWFPWLFLYSYRLIKGRGQYNVLKLGLSLFGLLMTHNLMSVAFIPVLLVWIVSLVLVKPDKTIMVRLVSGLGIGVGLAAFFVLPLIFERSFVHLESMTGGYFDYRQHFVNLYQLFWSTNWGYGSSYLGPGDDLSLSVGVVQWVLVVLGVGYYFTSNDFKKNSIRTLVPLMLTTSLVIFLSHQRSAFIWEKFKFLAMFQFPWRFLVISAFTMPVLIVYTWKTLPKKILLMMTIVSIVSIFLIYGNYFRPQKWLTVNDLDLLTEEEFVKQQTASIFDYLPKSAVLPPNYPAPDFPEITSGEVTVLEYFKGSNHQSGKLVVNSNEARVRLPIFDFPGMEVKDNGEKIYFDHNECRGQDYCFGQISFVLSKGTHDIEVRLKSTVPRKAGDLISLVTAFGIFMIIIKRKEWFR